MQKLFYILILMLLVSCSGKRLFVKNGEAKSSMYLYYCNDSLGVYAQFFGDFSQREFTQKRLYKSDRYVLKKSGFGKKTDKVLFHSFTTLEPAYNVLGLWRTQLDLAGYLRKDQKNGPFYVKDYFGKFNLHEVVYPIRDHFFSLVFYEKNDLNQNKLKNMMDYGEMEDYTLDALQQKSCGKENIADLANESFTKDPQGNYLSYRDIESVAGNYTNANEVGIYRQILATYLSFAQRNEQAETEFSKLLEKQEAPKAFTSKPLKVRSLIDTLKDHQIVLFNEAHHKPKHRYLVGLLLKPLYEAGFRYLGLEAFSDEDLLEQHGFPTLDNGFYVRESTMGNLIREAKKIGFKVFEYDAQGNNREEAQASNIYSKTFKADQNAKVLVLGGYSHIDEKDGWMAQQLSLKYGINPFTVNQTSYNTSNGRQKNALSLVAPLDKTFKCDLYLDNQIEMADNCFGSAQSKEARIDLPALGTTACVLLVYQKAEFEKAPNPIPVAVKVLEKGQSSSSVNLCPGNYKIIVRSYQGMLKYENNLNVN